MNQNDRALDELLEQVGDEFMAALARRGRSQRSLRQRSSFARLVSGDSVTLRVLVQLAASLGCQVEIRLVDVDVAPRGANSGTTEPSKVTLDA